jgi:hypothetical protein
MHGAGEPSLIEQPQIAETTAAINTQVIGKTIHDTMIP